MASDLLLRWQVGTDTDIGGGRENQDSCFIWENVRERICVVCVLDGHGREVGKIAATAARSVLLEFFAAHYTELKTSPYECLVRAHEIAHMGIKAAFRSELERMDFEVSETEEGYLLKRKMGVQGQPWSCVHGGSSCSICALVDGRLYIANVGDSTGTLCSLQPVLSRANVHPLGDSALAAGARAREPTVADTERSTTIVLTAEHSPECPYEYIRLRDFRPREGDPRQPSLNVVYDTPSHEKVNCPQVFALNEGGQPVVTNKGSYYKNVRKEWASLVSTPPSARFQDALAFTRSLGDLHLHTYGVTHYPEVQMVDLRGVFSALVSNAVPMATVAAVGGGAGAGAGAGTGDQLSDGTTDSEQSNKTAASTPPMLCLVLATDGVWDNWTYEDVTRFVMDSSCVDAVAAGADGAHRVALSFMQRNAFYSKRNFGNQADNATGIVLYISPAQSFPVTSPDFDA